MSAAHPDQTVYVDGHAVAWFQVPTGARAELVRSLADLLQGVAAGRATIRDMAQALTQSWKEMHFLNDLMTVLQQVMDLDDIAGLVVDKLARTCQARHVALYLVDGDQLVLAASHPEGSERAAPGIELVWGAWRDGEPLVGHRAEGCEVCVPIANEGGLGGALRLVGPARLGQAASLKFLTGVATQLAQAIKLRELIKQEIRAAELRQGLEFAAELQRSLRAGAFPAFPGLRFASACRASHIIAGDAVAAYPHGEHLDILVADVSGHGPAAGLLMASVLGMMRAIEPGRWDVGTVVTRLNGHVCQEVGTSGRFVTGLLIRVGPERTLTYASMGHPPPLLLREGEVTALPRPNGLAVGMLEGVTYASHTVALRPGDRVLLYTDGLTEARLEGGGFFGLDGIVAAMKEAGSATADQLLERVFSACRRAAGSAPNADDQTALVIEVLP